MSYEEVPWNLSIGTGLEIPQVGSTATIKAWVLLSYRRYTNIQRERERRERMQSRGIDRIGGEMTVWGRQGPPRKGTEAGGAGGQRGGGRHGCRAAASRDLSRAGQIRDMEVGAGCPQRGSPSLTQPLHPPHPQNPDQRQRRQPPWGLLKWGVLLPALLPLSPPFFLSPHLIPVLAAGPTSV